jgi:L-gulonolactone oxidase
VKSIPNFRFTNWAGNQTCVSKNYYQPETEAELIGIIRDNAKLRFVGTAHSWNDICLTGEALVNLDKYNRVLSLDKEKLLLTVEPGIKLWQLNEYLDKQGLALANLGSISKQSLAGAISTGTHGTGIEYQILGSQIECFTLIKADGSKIVLHHEKDKALFNTALVSLGCLGVFSEITLRVVPAFNLHDQTYVTNFETIIDNLHQLEHGTNHFKLWWFPHVDEVVVYRYTRTQQPVNDSRLRQWLMDEIISVVAYRAMLKIGTINREWRKGINRALVQKFIKPLDRIEKSYKVFNVPEPPLHREAEWAFDISQEQNLLRDYKRMINDSKHRINFLQEIRFTKADDYALSGCYGRDTMWLGVYNADNFGWEELLADFEVLAKQYQGRPHWGKEFRSADSNYLRSVYPKFDDFAKLRQEFDPEGKFMNDYINRIFGQD